MIKPLFIPNDLVSPDRKPTKENTNHHYDLTFAANKDDMGHFDRERFFDTVIRIYNEVESYVHDTTKMKILKYVMNVLKMNVSCLKELKSNLLPSLIIRNAELAWNCMYGWAECGNKAESIIMADEIMMSIGLDYISPTTGRNKGCINSLVKSRIRDIYRTMNQTLKFATGATLNRTGLKAKQKRLRGKFYEEFLHVLDEALFKRAILAECATLGLSQEGSTTELKARLNIHFERNKKVLEPEEANEKNSVTSPTIIETAEKTKKN